MGSLFSIRNRNSFDLPLMLAVFGGTASVALLYAAIHYGPSEVATLKRYCFSHPTAAVTLWLFCVAVAGIAIQCYRALMQWRMLRTFEQTLESFVVEGQDVPEHQRPLWLEAHLLALPQEQRDSWLGRSVAEILERQIKRGHCTKLEGDIRDLAATQSKRQRASHTLTRIICCAIPILGVVGTMSLLSSKAGSVQAKPDIQTRAEATVGTFDNEWNDLVAAGDPLALALVLTIPLLFMPLVAERLESSLLAAMHSTVRDNLVDLLATDAPAVSRDAAVPMRQMAEDLVSAVHQLVEQQATLWTRSLTEAQKQWSAWSTTSSDQLRSALCESLEQSLTRHAQEIDRIQQEAGRQIDARWQQWQITLSDQARVMHAQQKELVRQTESIERLITCTTDLKKVEDAVRESFGSFEIIEQLKQSTLGVAEAVAVLGSGLERAGIIRGAPVKPRVTRRVDDDDEQLGQGKAA